MTEINTKTPGETAEVLFVSGMTLRNYVKKFEPFLSEQATAPTRRRFTPEDIATLKRASSLLRDGFKYEEVSEQLKEEPPEPPLEGDVFTSDEVPPAEPEPEDEPPGAPKFEMASIEFFTNVIDTLNAEHKTTLNALDERIEELKTDKERLQRQLNYERLPWWKRAFREPPE